MIESREYYDNLSIEIRTGEDARREPLGGAGDDERLPLAEQSLTTRFDFTDLQPIEEDPR